MAIITIKQIADDDADLIGLTKYKKSKLPGTVDRLQVATSNDGRFLTGFDEGSFLVKTDAERERLKEIRLKLESRLGQPLDGLSPYWKTFWMKIYSDNDLVLNTNNVLDEITWRALIANGYAAPDKEAVSKPMYKDAKYYCFTEETEVKEQVSTRRIRDKAVGLLTLIGDSTNKMSLIGQYLEGIKYNDKMGPDTLYNNLRAYIEQPDIKFANLFIKANEMPIEDLQRKILVDKAFKARLITTNKVGKKTIYQFGQVTLGASPEEVYLNMASPEFSNELMTIKNELETR